MKADQFVLENWAEVLTAILLLVGFFIALVITSPALNYLIIFLSGLLAGRMLYQKHKIQPIFPFILIIIGFLFGFMLGAISANKSIVTILFIIAITVSYYAHKRGYIGFFKSESFIK